MKDESKKLENDNCPHKGVGILMPKTNLSEVICNSKS